ncbi:hypothetical protein A6A08_04940 [Nocardiopsis sp. TSRI0078]|uniref:hypothetical protein n=1 Tax=unclassified Nocardiopsis TaxID=2649073 RepID=UPI00093B4B3C|nr:hypothetical protein [Nocardiopsis sp. TSRI0078]OKI18961.1 hypothetical protein A6A08_04940 [Nocardiopsis sp. TSRI0078]
MRKHHKRWVALFGAAAIASSGLVGLPGATAGERDTRAQNRPVASQSASSYSLDGYEIGYLPEGLEEYGISASSVTDRKGNKQSQISWIQGPDQLFGRVTVLRSESIQSLEDLRSMRYGHLREGSLQRMERNEALEHESYLSQETGDLFWMEKPGVAMAVHLQPDRWGSGELVRMAESLKPADSSPQDPAEEPAGEGAPSEEPTAKESGQGGPAAGGQATGAEGVQEPAGGAVPLDKVADGTPADVAGNAPVGRPADPRPSDAPQVPEAPQAPEASEAPAGQGETPAEQEQTPAEQGEAPAEPGGQGEQGTQDEGARVRQAKECLIGRFVDFETGGTSLDQSGMAPSSGAFVERVLAQDRLGAAELDRLLATAWYYGGEKDKTGAVSGCARDLAMTRAEVEEAVFGLSSLIAEIVREAEQHGTGSTRTVEPIGAEEWQALWDSLPWSFPAATS